MKAGEFRCKEGERDDVGLWWFCYGLAAVCLFCLSSGQGCRCRDTHRPPPNPGSPRSARGCEKPFRVCHSRLAQLLSSRGACRYLELEDCLELVRHRSLACWSIAGRAFSVTPGRSVCLNVCFGALTERHRRRCQGDRLYKAAFPFVDRVYAILQLLAACPSCISGFRQGDRMKRAKAHFSQSASTWMASPAAEPEYPRLRARVGHLEIQAATISVVAALQLSRNRQGAESLNPFAHLPLSIAAA